MFCGPETADETSTVEGVGIKHGSGITEIWNCGSGKRDKTRKKG